MSHALLSASGSHRWLNCTPSARLEEKLEDKSSPMAAEGTLAHAMAEYNLTQYLKTKKDITEYPEEFTGHELYNPGMLDYIHEYTDYCKEAFMVEGSRSMMIEKRLDFSRYVKDGFGTADCIIIRDKELELIDLKFGSGVEVFAQNNTQLQLYALGAIEQYRWLYGFDQVKMTIVQPRKGSITSQVMTVEELERWGEGEVWPKAQLAYEGKGEQCAGEWCRFCKVGVRCRAYSEYSTEAIKNGFPDLSLLSDDELVEILKKAPQAIKYLNALSDYALEEALRGKKWPGYKLVEGRAVRKYKDELMVVQKLTGEGINEVDIYKPREIKTITQMEKQLGKKMFTTLLGDLVIKPQGKPTLVVETDKRPEYMNFEILKENE